MTDETKVQVGNYKGVGLRIEAGSITGGRKHVVNQFPNRDTQTVEDLGLKPRDYDLSIIVSDFGKFAANEAAQLDYFEYRDMLLATLEDKTPGDLIHPFYGRINNIVAVTYNMNENFSEFGRSVIHVAFKVTNDTGIPQSNITALSNITEGNNLLISAVNGDISGNFLVTSGFSGNFGAAVDKVNSIIDGITDATSFIGATADEINDFARQIGAMSNNVNSLVSQPQALADSFGTIMATVNGLFATVSVTAQSFAGLFGFGADDGDTSDSTAGLVQRNRNNDVLNGAVNAQSLGYAYVNTAQVTFETVRQIDQVANTLEIQYQAVIDGGASQEVKDAATDMRVQVQAFFDEQKVTARQIITIHTYTTSARLLSFDYYGESDNGDEIVALNDTPDVSFISGDLEILTV